MTVCVCVCVCVCVSVCVCVTWRVQVQESACMTQCMHNFVNVSMTLYIRCDTIHVGVK